MSKHKTQGCVCLTCTVSAVRAIVDDDSPISQDQVVQYMADAKAKLDLNTVRWAIEDEAERGELQELVVQTATAAYFRKD